MRPIALEYTERAGMSASDTVLENTEFVGEISINGETAPIVFRVSAGLDCRLHFDADAVAAQTHFLALRAQGAPGKNIGEFTLTGASVDAKTIASKSVFVRSHGHDNDRRWIDIRSRDCKITLCLEYRVEKPVLRLWFRSFVSFRNPVIETSLGRLMVWDEVGNVGPDDVSGGVALEAPSHDAGDDWRNRAEDFLRHMHRGLALAHGGRLQAPRLDFIHELTSEITFFEGTGFMPELPVQHSLYQDQFIKALVHRYERAGPLPDILWTALGWMQTDTTFDELRFLSGMTALEAIIESRLPKRRVTTIPKKDFKLLRRRFEEIIAADEALPQQAKELVSRNVGNLNRKGFPQSIHSLFEYYMIPKRDF
jgi:hypothetical protein